MENRHYSLDQNGELTDERTGAVYPFPFRFEERDCWADEKAGDKGLAALAGTPDTLILSFATEAGRRVVKEVRQAKSKEVREAKAGGWPVGLAISVGPEQIRPATPTAPTKLLRFEGRLYRPDDQSLGELATTLPDGRRLSFWTGESGELKPAAILINDDKPRGISLEVNERGELVGAGSIVPVGDMNGSEIIYAPTSAFGLEQPPTPEELAELVDTSPDALDTKKHEAPIVNLPINFYVMGTQDPQTGQLQTHPVAGIPLGMFRVPDWFGTPPDDDEEESRERMAFWLLTTANGTIASTRDNKRVELPALSIVWIDLKYDLRPIVRFLPRFEGGRLVSANKVLITPRGKFPFQRKTAKGQKPAFAWRLELKWLERFSQPARLAKIHAMAALVPQIPTRPEDAIDTIGEATP